MSFELNEKAKKTFCPLAWNHSFVNQNGAFQLCCTSEEFDNNVRTEDNKRIFIPDGWTTEQVMNTEWMKKIRLKMLNGEWPEVCNRCKWTEDLKGSSRRNVENVGYKDKIEEMIKSTAPDGSTTYKVTSADYRLGNLCNLQCRMCNPRSTKLWIKDWNSVKPAQERFDTDRMKSYSAYDWIDSEDLVRDFQNKASSLEHIHFAGGEPLLVPQMSKILQICIDSGNAQNIVLTYNTNLTLLPKKVLELWKSFKGVKILASIDAVGDRNYYIRYPAKWDQIDQNLRFIDENHKEYNIEECMLSTTVQALNVLNLFEIYEYLGQFKFIVKAPNLINLYFPYYMQTTILPPAMKKFAWLQLHQIAGTLRPKLEPHYHYLLDNIANVINHMNLQDNYNDGRFAQFVEFQGKFDQLKNLKMVDYCPEFTQYLTDYPKAKQAQDIP